MRRHWAVIVVVALVGACSTSTSATPAPAVASPVVPSTAPSLGPTAPSASPPAPAVSWAQVFRADQTLLFEIASWPTGLLAVGCTTDQRGDCKAPLMLVSADGATWTPVQLPDSADGGISSVRQAGGRLFALGGWNDGEALVWTSQDGLAWTPIHAKSFSHRNVDNVIDSPVGMLAYGIRLPYPGTIDWGATVVWDVSADGSFGDGRDVRPTGWGAPNSPGIVWTGKQFLAWGTVLPSSGEISQLAILMTSADGKTWTVLPQAAAFRGAWVSQIATSQDLLVAVGYVGVEQPLTPRVWTSADGTDWAAAVVPAAEGDLGTVRFDGTAWVARGRGPEGQPFAWASADGQTWVERASGDELPPVTGLDAMPDAATFAGRTCVVGSFFSEPIAAIYCR